MTPEVQVGIPTRNRPQYVREAIASVLAQRYRNLRVLVTDNDSAPEHAKSVREYVASLGDPRIEYVSNPVPDGERGQTLYNFARCEAPYFMLVHDDDRISPTLIERAVAALDADPSLAFFACSQTLIDERGQRLDEETARYNRWLRRDALNSGPVDDVLAATLRGGAFSMSGTLFRQRVMAEVGFTDPHGGGFPIDLITFLRIGEAGHRGYFANESLAEYRWHAGQSRVKHQHWTFNEWMIELYVAQFEARRFRGESERLRRGLLSLGLCRLAIVRLVGGDAAAARALLRRAVAVSPLTWQAWAYCGLGHCLPAVIRRRWGAHVVLREPARRTVPK